MILLLRIDAQIIQFARANLVPNLHLKLLCAGDAQSNG